MYYEYMTTRTANNSASAAFSSTVFISIQWAGFTGAITIVLLHYLIIIIITWLFLSRTGLSILGDYWHAFSQVISEDTIPIFDRVSQMEDKEARRRLGELHPGLKVNCHLVAREGNRVSLKLKSISFSSV
jgi:hypothetical protein